MQQVKKEENVVTQSIARLFDLTGKGAVVTGGAMGIGQAIAFRLAEAGASVVVADIDLQAASETAEQINVRGGSAQAIRADLGSLPDAEQTIRTAVGVFGRLDILANNAAIYPLSPVLKVGEELWDRVHNVNLKGVFFCSKAAAQEMVGSGQGGKIINIASVDAFHPTRGTAHYSASKGGVVMLTKALALELAPHNILVNAIAPGPVATPGNKELTNMLRTNEKAAKGFISRIPLGRVAEPDEIAKVALFLASTAADYMTGSVVLVDGGYLLS